MGLFQSKKCCDEVLVGVRVTSEKDVFPFLWFFALLDYLFYFSSDFEILFRIFFNTCVW